MRVEKADQYLIIIIITYYILLICVTCFITGEMQLEFEEEQGANEPATPF